MTGIDFLEKINDIDTDLLEASESYKSEKKNSWLIWLPLAATIMLAIGLGFLISHNRLTGAEYQNTLVAFYFDDLKYETPSLNDYVRLGLADQGNEMRGGISIDPISSKDLGEKIGEVVIEINQKNVTCNLYRHIDFSDDSSICIIEFPGNDYQMYIAKER